MKKKAAPSRAHASPRGSGSQRTQPKAQAVATALSGNFSDPFEELEAPFELLGGISGDGDGSGSSSCTGGFIKKYKLLSWNAAEYSAAGNLTSNCRASELTWELKPPPATIDGEGLVAFGSIGQKVDSIVPYCKGVPVDNMSATIAKVDIFRGGENITDKETEVWVGERIQLTAKVVPNDVTISNVRWAIPDVVVAGYTGSLAVGKTNELTDDARRHVMVGFYWVDGSLDPPTRRDVYVSLIVSRGDQAVELYAKTTFKVKRPFATIRPEIITPATFSSLDPVQIGDFLMCDAWLNMTIWFWRDDFTGGGRTIWVQLADIDRRNSGPPDTFKDWEYAGALDGSYPYDDGEVTHDKPLHNASSTFGKEHEYLDTLHIADEFRMWLMFKPDVPGKSIFVPLRVVQWSWGVDAFWYDHALPWQPIDPPYGRATQDQDTLVFPQWTTHVPNPMVPTSHHP